MDGIIIHVHGFRPGGSTAALLYHWLENITNQQFNLRLFEMDIKSAFESVSYKDALGIIDHAIPLGLKSFLQSTTFCRHVRFSTKSQDIVALTHQFGDVKEMQGLITAISAGERKRTRDVKFDCLVQGSALSPVLFTAVLVDRISKNRSSGLKGIIAIFHIYGDNIYIQRSVAPESTVFVVKSLKLLSKYFIVKVEQDMEIKGNTRQKMCFLGITFLLSFRYKCIVFNGGEESYIRSVNSYFVTKWNTGIGWRSRVILGKKAASSNRNAVWSGEIK